MNNASRLCPHKQNPLACLECYQARTREQQTRPKGTGGEPEVTMVGGMPIPRAGVVPFAQAQANPVARALLAKKEAAIAKLGARAEAAPAPVAPTPKMAAKSKAAEVDADGEEASINGVYTQAQLLELASEFEAHNSIIDSHERHPEADSKPGQPFRR